MLQVRFAINIEVLGMLWVRGGCVVSFVSSLAQEIKAL
jgi:hypothetical protein